MWGMVSRWLYWHYGGRVPLHKKVFLPSNWLNLSAFLTSYLKSHWFIQRCREKDPSLTIKYKQKKLDQAGKDVSRKIKKEKKKQEQKSKEKELAAPQYPQCGECINCYRAEDCGKCDACRGKKGKQCKYRVCLNYAPKVCDVLITCWKQFQ